MKKIIIITALAFIPILASAEGNTNEVLTTICAHQSTYVLSTSQSNTLLQPSRRDVAGAVLLDDGAKDEIIILPIVEKNQPK